MPINDVRKAVSGRVWLPGEDGFEPAAKAWNLTVAQPVAAVVEADDADDVASLVRYARREGLTVTAQPHGHGAAGDAEGLILLRTTRLDEVTIDAGRRLARVGAGVSWQTVQTEAAKQGLTGLSGSAPQVSVTGYTLGGGLSWFSRKYGLAAHSVVAFDVADAEGRRGRVTAESDPDLFWALCGGGGDFAIVTAVEFTLYPAQDLYGGRIMWHGQRAREAFAAFRDLTADAPRELSMWIHRLQFPQAPPMVAVDVTYLGGFREAEGLLARLGTIGDPIDDSRTMRSTADLGAITAEPTDPVPVLPRAELLTGLDDATAEVLLGEPIDPLLDVHLRHLGGALADPGPFAGASGQLAEPYLLYMLGLGLEPDLGRAVRAEQAELVAELGGTVSGRKPYTFLGPGEKAVQAFSPQTLIRLREIKRARDPYNVFRANFSVLG